MIHKLTWLIILVLGIFNLALADTVGPIRSMPPNPVGHDDRVKSVAFSPDGHYVLSGSNDNTMKLWQVDNGAEIRTFKGHRNSVKSVVFSPDGRYALSGSSDKTMKLWELSSGAEIRSFGPTDYVHSVAISPDGRYALSGGQDQSMKLWNVSSGVEIRSFGNTARVNSVAFSPDGSYALSGYVDGTMKLWEVSSGTKIRTFTSKGHTNSFSGVESVAFSPDGHYVLSGGGQFITLWNLSSGAEIRSFGPYSYVSSVAFSPDGSYALSGIVDDTMKLLDLSSGADIRSFAGHSDAVSSVAISPNGSYALSGSWDNTIKLWNLSSGAEIRTMGSLYDIYSIAISPDGRYALSGSLDNTIKLWDLSSGTEIRIFAGHTERVRSVAFSPDGSYALSGGGITMKLWNISSGTEIRSFEHDDYVWVSSVAFSPDGSYAISRGGNSIKLWELSNGAEIRSFEHGSNNGSYFESVAISPDGRYALSASDNNIMKLWELSSGTEIRTFKGHTQNISSVAFSPDSSYALSGSMDKTMKLWNVSNGAEIRTFKGHTQNVLSVTFSPDGHYALSGSWDTTMKLWELSSGTEIRSFAGHTKPVRSVAFSSDSRYVYSGSEDGTLKMWNAVIQVNQPPQATFTINPNTGLAPLTVQLDASASTDDANIVKYQWTSSDGQSAEGIKTSLTFSQVGTYNITLTVTDNEGATASSSQSVTVNEKPLPPTSDSIGQAIIIAAGGAQPNNTLYPYSNEYTQRFYRILKERGFKDENIAYMNPQAPDINLDGHLEQDLLDYELFEPESELKKAFQQAANNLTAGQQFIFFLHGHARPDYFRIMDNYELSATYLRDLLAMLPANIQQILILDSCYSGSFFDELMAPNRILISSADNQTQAWNTKNASFTDTFLRSLRRGMTLTESFQQAEDLIIKDKQLFGEQKPWLDDDGNGSYNSGDGRTAAKIQLGKQGFHAAPPPTISKVHSAIVLEQNITEANIWVHTTPGVDGIRKVRAILINPQFSSGEYKGLETNFGREKLELIYNPVQQRYGIVYQGFKTPGKWRILYQAQSKEGVWSDIVQGEVQAQGSSKIATIKIAPNLSSYKSTEPVRLDLQIYGQTEADLYVAIIFPEYFITYGYPSDPSYPNDAKIYQTIEIAGQGNYQVNINLPSNAKSGQYSACAVLVKTDTAPLDMANWIDFHCAEFEVSD